MNAPGEMATVRVSRKGADRWTNGHPWIFASDVLQDSDGPGVVAVCGPNGKPLGMALYSPQSEIRLRLLDSRPHAVIGAAWWRERIQQAHARRGLIDATGYRVVFGEADGLPSLIVDRYDRWAVGQLLSAGLETERAAIVEAVRAELNPAGILLRNDANVRRREGLPTQVELVFGEVPQDIEIREGRIRYLASPWTGQKTGAFLDQRDNRLKAASLLRPGGRGLDCFSYHGSFALHLAATAESVVALDISEAALARGAQNAALNGLANIEWRLADAFEELRTMERAKESFDLVVVDPPAFAKTKAAVPQALKGYKDINLRAIRLVRAGGYLLTASCSWHVGWPDFLDVIKAAAADSTRRVTMIERLSQPPDHPEVLSIPETGYLKGALLRVD